MKKEKIYGPKILEELGAKPSISEERGLSLMRDDDLNVFSPGISTGGIAEIRMAQANPNRHIIATTIDGPGLLFAQGIIDEVWPTSQIETRLEDLRNADYPKDSFDFIYARLVLHYLSAQDLNNVLANLSQSLKPGGRLFVVVRSETNIDRTDPNTKYDPLTRLTTQAHYDAEGVIKGTSVRYFHTPETITNHLETAGLNVSGLEEYEEQLYIDFMRKKISPVKDHVIEVVASK